MTQQAPLSNFAGGKADKPSGFSYHSGEFEVWAPEMKNTTF